MDIFIHAAYDRPEIDFIDFEAQLISNCFIIALVLVIKMQVLKGLMHCISIFLFSWRSIP